VGPGGRPRLVGAVRRLAVASLVAQVLLIGTGGAVRLSDSGLGCPTWPRCTATSYVNTPAYGLHGDIEFGNRLLTVVLTVLTVATAVAAVAERPRRRDHRRLAIGLLVGIPAQAVLGGVSVLTHLDPWVVSLHYLASAVLVAIATVLVHRTRPGVPAGRRTWAVPRLVQGLVLGSAVTTAAVVYVGTVVTGSGPHAGDRGSARTGLDPAQVAQLHADLVTLLIGLTIGLAVAVRLPAAAAGRSGVAGIPTRAGTVVAVLLAVEVAQAGIGWVQYATGLPVALVDLHLMGAALVVAAVTAAVLATRAVDPLSDPVVDGD